MPLRKFGEYRYLKGRTVVHGLHSALVGHVATRWLPHSVRLTKQQTNLSDQWVAGLTPPPLP
jgi:hypothetical protein